MPYGTRVLATKDELSSERVLSSGADWSAGARPRETTVDLRSVGHVFRAGHQVRAQITWSCLPRWDLIADQGGTVTIHPGSAITLPDVRRH
jgi:predicted acyl esterase